LHNNEKEVDARGALFKQQTFCKSKQKFANFPVTPCFIAFQNIAPMASKEGVEQI